MSSTQGSRTLTDIASDLCTECRHIPTWYYSIPKNQLIGAALVAETACRGHLGCLRAALGATPGQDLCLNGLRRIVPVRRLRGNPLNGQEVPETLQRKFSLKDICRRKIRQNLLDLDPQTHLFSGVLRLGLPASLTAYVLYDIALGDVGEYMDDDDFGNDDDVNRNCSLDVAVGSDIDDNSGGKYVATDSDDDDYTNGGGEDIDTDSEDNGDNSNNFSLDVTVGNDVDDWTSGDVIEDDDDNDYSHDCSLDVTIGSDYSNRAHDAVFDSDDDDCSLAVAIDSDIDNYSNDGGQDCGSDNQDLVVSSDVGGDDEEEDDDDHDDDSSDGNPDVIDSDGYDSGNGSSLVFVSCDDEDDDYSNNGSLAAINSDGYDSGEGGRLDIVSSDDDNDNNSGVSLDVVVDSDDNGDDDGNLDIVSSDDDDDDDDCNGCSLVVVIDSDDDDDIANVNSLDPISNDDSNDTHRDYLNVDFPLKHLEYLNLRIKELDPRTQIFNRALYMFNQ